jgi:hypothetical protein
MEINSKKCISINEENLELSTSFFLTKKLSTYLANMYSRAKAGIQTRIWKIHTKMKNRFMCTKRQNSWVSSFSSHEPHICHFRMFLSWFEFASLLFFVRVHIYMYYICVKFWINKICSFEIDFYVSISRWFPPIFCQTNCRRMCSASQPFLGARLQTAWPKRTMPHHFALLRLPTRRGAGWCRWVTWGLRRVIQAVLALSWNDSKITGLFGLSSQAAVTELQPRQKSGVHFARPTCGVKSCHWAQQTSI